MKENYLLTIFKEHQKKPYKIWRLSGCGGCVEIEKRLFACMEKDLGVVSNPNTYKDTQGRYIYSHPKRKEMLLNLCEKINDLDKFDVDAMSRVSGDYKFYEINPHRDNFLKFIIMYVWDNLSCIKMTSNREEQLEILRKTITNIPVLKAINSMNHRYERNVLIMNNEKPCYDNSVTVE